MSSTRLPGKVLAPVLGEPMIVRQLERIARSELIQQTVIATSTHESDDPLAEELARRGFTVRRGSLSDVLERFLMIVEEFEPSHVVRLTGDCPLTDPEVIDTVIRSHLEVAADYTSNALHRTFPHGLDAEIVRADALRRLRDHDLTEAEREHVTLGVYSRPAEFLLNSVGRSEDLSALRWTVDYPADLEFVRSVYRGLQDRVPYFTTDDVLGFLHEHPELNRTGADV